jgi:hypothetical protein
MPDTDRMNAEVDQATAYLAEPGGMGEVIGLVSVALETGQPKVQMDAGMAMALCILAAETLTRRRAH